MSDDINKLIKLLGAESAEDVERIRRHHMEANPKQYGGALSSELKAIGNLKKNLKYKQMTKKLSDATLTMPDLEARQTVQPNKFKEFAPHKKKEKVHKRLAKRGWRKDNWKSKSWKRGDPIPKAFSDPEPIGKESKKHFKLMRRGKNITGIRHIDKRLNSFLRGKAIGRPPVELFKGGRGMGTTYGRMVKK